MTAERVVCRPCLAIAAYTTWAADADLRVWTIDRRAAFRFANLRAARAALDAACITDPELGPDPYLRQFYRIDYPTIGDAAQAYIGLAGI